MYRRIATALIASAAISACTESTAPRQTAMRTASVAAAAVAASDVQHINQQYTINGYYQFNPCNGELVLFNGARYHVNGTITTTSTGQDFKLHLNTEDFQGVGLTTGLKYLYHQQTRESDMFTYNPFTQKLEEVVSYAVISQGSTDNYQADFTFTYTYPPGTFEFTSDARCTG